MNEDPWYADLRREWRPPHVRLLLIGESAPDPGETEKRFFYREPVHQYDSLFRSVVKAFYDATVHKGELKEPWLRCLRDDGAYLIDLVPYPVNKLSSGDRRRAWSEHAGACVAEAAGLEPDGVVVCHGPSYKVIAPKLRERAALLHEDPIPFPLGNKREEFVDALRPAAARVGLTLPRRCPG